MRKQARRSYETLYSFAHAQEVEHAGYKRAIISRNPPLIDEDGYSIDSDDDEQHVQDAIAAAAEGDPYSSIHLERMQHPSALPCEFRHGHSEERLLTST